jgi:hypothetical protein
MCERELIAGACGRFTQIEARGEGEKVGDDETAAGHCWVESKNPVDQ